MPRPNVKLCDFGYSKNEFVDSRPKTVSGTPDYIAPEVPSIIPAPRLQSCHRVRLCGGCVALLQKTEDIPGVSQPVRMRPLRRALRCVMVEGRLRGCAVTQAALVMCRCS